MRKCEVAVVKIAVKSSLKSGSFETGYKTLKKWSEHKNSEMIDIESVLKCFNKWVKWKIKQ